MKKRFILTVFSSCFVASCVLAQSVTGIVDVGLEQYHSYHGGDIDNVNLDTGNLTISFPMVSYPQRGQALKMDFGMVYNGTGRAYQKSICVLTKCTYVWLSTSLTSASMSLTPESLSASPALVDLQQITAAVKAIPLNTTPASNIEVYSFATADGASHPAGQTSSGQVAIDGSGFQAGFTYSSTTETCTWDCSLPSIVPSPFLIGTQNGITYMASSTGAGSARTDADGNYIVGNGSEYIDTVGRTIPIPSVNSSVSTACPNSPLAAVESVTWTPPGYAEPFTFCYADITLTIATLETTGTYLISHPTQVMLQSIILPNGQSWTFEYNESLSGCVGGTTNVGDLTQVTLPSGGTIQYAYECITPPGTVTVPYYTTAVTSRTVNANDGTGAHTWTYAYLTAAGTVVTDPLGNQSTHSFTATSRVVKQYSGSQSSGTLLQTTTTTYPSQYAMVGGFPMNPSSVVTTLENGQSTTTTYQICCDFTFNHVTSTNGAIFPTAASYGKVTDTKVYDYATSGTGPLLKETAVAYLFQSNSNYVNPGFLSLASTQTIYNGSGTEMAQTSNGFDETARVTSGIASLSGAQMTTPIYSVYGHQTSTTNWLNTGGGNPKSTVSYYDTGGPYQSTDPLGHTTSTYLCTGSSPATVPCTASTYLGALPTVVANALGQQTTYSYRSDTGQLVTTTDPNGQPTTNSYGDSMNRLTSISYPDGGSTGIQYNDIGQIGATVTQKISSSPSLSKETQAIVDGLGRDSETVLLSDPYGATYTYNTYDALGRKSLVSNPTRCNPPTTNCGEATWGVTTYQYDALSRETLLIPPDGSATADNQKTSYSGNTTTATDEAGHYRTSTVDALGRLTQISEGSAGYITAYTYDALGNLTCVEQHGGVTGTGCTSPPADDATSAWRVRRFTYDSLSRLLASTNPESGAITYSYDADSNVHTKTSPLPNQTGSATDTKTYTYDALNRISSITYSDGITPSLSYFYDVAPPWMSDLQNVVGRLANSTNQYGGGTSGQGTATTYSYDPMGRVIRKWEQTPSMSPGGLPEYTAYNLAGDIASTANAAGTTISYTYNAADALTEVTSSLSDSQHPATLYTVDPSVGYFPNRSVRKATLGNGLTETSALNNRLQPCRIGVNSSGSYYSNCTSSPLAGTVVDFTLGYNIGSTNNGNIASWASSGQQTFARSYTYDNMNRISTMADTASGQTCKGLSWTTDPWGNVTAQTVTSGSCYSFSSAAGDNNRLSVYQYDAAGNVSYDGVHHYTYDAEGRVLQVDSGSTASYVYNESGQRARKSSGSSWTEYLHGVNGDVEAEYNGSWPVQYASAAGRLLAIYQNSTTDFVHTDHLGSTRLLTGVNQSIVDNMDYEPYGEQTVGGNDTTHKFTGQERDSESGNDYFGARYYASSMGRFLSPDDDDEALSEFGNPQNLNLYSYVSGNPLTNTDPSGHDCISQSRTGSTTVEVTVTSGGSPGGCGATGTYVAGTVDPNSIKAGADGHSIDIGYTPYSDSSETGVMNVNAISSNHIADNGQIIPSGDILFAAAGLRAAGAAADFFGAAKFLMGSKTAVNQPSGPVVARIGVRTGGWYNSTIETTAGPLQVIFKVTPEGDTAVIDEMDIRAADSNATLNVGSGQIKQIFSSIFKELKADGFNSAKISPQVRTGGWHSTGMTNEYTYKLR